jgi:multidrug efflux pump subunit AcrA (membrane-fusion protein)
MRPDPASGTLRCRAVFPNANGLLMPGMLARLRLPTSPPTPALLVPERAIITDRDQRLIFVVTEANTVVRRAAELGMTMDSLRVIRAGVADGEWIVIDPPRELTTGAKVRPHRVAIPIEK